MHHFGLVNINLHSRRFSIIVQIIHWLLQSFVTVSHYCLVCILVYLNTNILRYNVIP